MPYKNDQQKTIDNIYNDLHGLEAAVVRLINDYKPTKIVHCRDCVKKLTFRCPLRNSMLPFNPNGYCHAAATEEEDTECQCD